MNETLCHKTNDVFEMLRKLAVQFSENLKTALSNSLPELNRAELKTRCLSSVGVILRDKCATSESQKEVASIYDEIFADCVCSLYLAAQGLDKPAQIVLRRVLELGVAAVYLWDLPHVFWGWKAYDKDLNFHEMTDQLSALPYLQFVGSENGTSGPKPIFGCCPSPQRIPSAQ